MVGTGSELSRSTLLTRRDVTLGWGTIIQADLPSLIEIAGARGFSSVTVAPAKYSHAALYGIDAVALRRQLAAAGVQVSAVDQVSYGLPGLSMEQPEDLPPTHHTGVSLESCMKIADALNCGLLTISHYRGDPATPVTQLADALGEICHRASKAGFSLALEPIPGTGVPDLGTAAAIREMVAPAPLQLVVDTWHLSGSGETAEQIEALPKESIAIFQLADRADAVNGSVIGRSLPGEGSLPLHDLLRSALRNSPLASLQVEIFHPALRSLPPSAAAAKVGTALDSWLRQYS